MCTRRCTNICSYQENCSIAEYSGRYYFCIRRRLKCKQTAWRNLCSSFDYSQMLHNVKHELVKPAASVTSEALHSRDSEAHHRRNCSLLANVGSASSVIRYVMMFHYIRQHVARAEMLRWLAISIYRGLKDS